MDLSEFAAEVGGTNDGAVTIAGASTRGGGVRGCRAVSAPAGIDWIQADEMIVSCGARTLVTELDAALADVNQCVALPNSGTVGGALAVGRSDIRRLGYGPVRDVLLQARYVSAAGDIVKAGGPTVKNVSGFDLCRLLVGSRGTLGFIGDVILRTRPLAAVSQWYRTEAEPFLTFAQLYRPVSVLWDGAFTWVLLEGHASDVREQSELASLSEVAGPPALPTAARWSMPPSQLHTLSGTSGFVAEIGVGIVHHSDVAAVRSQDPAVLALHDRLKAQFDPTRRLNPGIDLFDV